MIRYVIQRGKKRQAKCRVSSVFITHVLQKSDLHELYDLLDAKLLIGFLIYLPNNPPSNPHAVIR